MVFGSFVKVFVRLLTESVDAFLMWAQTSGSILVPSALNKYLIFFQKNFDFQLNIRLFV